MTEEGLTPDDAATAADPAAAAADPAATAAEPAATETPAEAQEPFEQPEPTRRVHRFRGFDNNVEFGYETLEYAGRNGGLVIVVEPLVDEDGTQTYPGGLEQRFQSVALQVAQYYSQMTNVETEVLVHMADPVTGEDVWLQPTDNVQVRWAPQEDAKVQAVMQAAQAKGMNPISAVMQAQKAGMLGSVSASPVFEKVAPDALREIFSAHEPPQPENSAPFGFNRPGPEAPRKGTQAVPPPSRLMPGTDIRHGFGFDGGLG